MPHSYTRQRVQSHGTTFIFNLFLSLDETRQPSKSLSEVSHRPTSRSTTGIFTPPNLIYFNKFRQIMQFFSRLALLTSA
jgi:hypothetical protein